MSKELCASCCAVYSVLGIVLLLFFGALFQNKAMTFAVISAKHEWHTDQKATACYMAAIFYGVTLLISVLSKVYIAKGKAGGR
jgi:hypothetical protein